MVRKVRWRPDVVSHDYVAAGQYLSLRLDPDTAKRLVVSLRRSKLTVRRANDILRACDRDPLPVDDPGVARALHHIQHRKSLSPVLVVSYQFGADIADGYHRVSACYHLDPFAAVPLRIAAA